MARRRRHHPTGHYAYRVIWLADDQEFVGLCAEFPRLSWFDTAATAALAGIVHLVSEAVGNLQKAKEPLPKPLAKRDDSGEFPIRILPRTPRRPVIEAAEAESS